MNRAMQHSGGRCTLHSPGSSFLTDCGLWRVEMGWGRSMVLQSWTEFFIHSFIHSQTHSLIQYLLSTCCMPCAMQRADETAGLDSLSFCPQGTHKSREGNNQIVKEINVPLQVY